jgi:SAM-dependent methyltransferase
LEAVGVEIVNVEQATAWDGDEGDHWVEHADRYEAAGRRLWEQFVAADLIEARDRVLDVGCGTGGATRDAAKAASAGTATGVDLSARMLAQAREQSKAEGIENITFVQADAQVYPFPPGTYDVAISRFGAMFFADPVAAFHNIGASLTPGGRLALLTWRELAANQWLLEIRNALAVGRTLPEPPVDGPSPFALADTDRVQRLLHDAGFEEVDFTKVDDQMEFGSDAADAFGFLRSMGIVAGLTQGLDEATKLHALDALQETVAAHSSADGVLFGSAAWLITARRAEPDFTR